MIIAFLLGLMKFWRIAGGISVGYWDVIWDKVSVHTVWLALVCAAV
jgi:hypothetical protein